MASRLELQTMFEGICKNVYYQPPTGKQLKYPCIVYQLEKPSVKFANNKMYNLKKIYDITVISKLPDPTEYTSVMQLLQNVSFENSFISDNLYHYKLTYSTTY